MHVLIYIYYDQTDKRLKRQCHEGGGGREGEGEKNSPEYSCPLVAVCGSAADCATVVLTE